MRLQTLLLERKTLNVLNKTLKNINKNLEAYQASSIKHLEAKEYEMFELENRVFLTLLDMSAKMFDLRLKVAGLRYEK